MKKCPSKQDKKDPDILIYRGDNSNALGLQTINLKIKTELDLTGCTLFFKFLDFEESFTEFSENETEQQFIISIDSETSFSFPLGLQHAVVYITDKDGRRRTLANDILVLVTDDLKTAYDISNDIDVVIPSDYRNALIGTEFDEGSTIRELRKFVGKIGKTLGADITEI